MDYRRIYSSFISSRKERQETLKSSGGYFELHHVIPRSLGGDNSHSNIIALTAREHYFAHCCLAKAFGGKMWSALFAIASMTKVNGSASYFLRSRMVAVSREKAAAVRSKDMKARWADGSFKRNRVYGPLTDDVKKKISDGNMGRKSSVESIERAKKTKRNNAHEYDFKNVETGLEFSGTQSEFCAEAGVGQSLASCLTRGKIKSAKGWMIRETDPAQINGRDPSVRIFKHKSGEMFRGTSSQFIEKTGADSGSVSKIINRKPLPKTVFGWSYLGEDNG